MKAAVLIRPPINMHTYLHSKKFCYRPVTIYDSSGMVKTWSTDKILRAAVKIEIVITYLSLAFLSVTYL